MQMWHLGLRNLFAWFGLATVGTLLAACVGLPQTSAEAKMDTHHPELMPILAKIDTSQCGHLAVAWVEGEKSGKQILAADEQVDSQSIYEIGSISKGFTGIALAQEVLSGDIGLEDSIYSSLPFDNLSRFEHLKRVTIEDLSTHASGLPRLGMVSPLYVLRNRNDPYKNFTKSLLARELSKENLWRPNRVEYSNLGFGLLGFLAAQQYEHTYATLIEKNVLQPLSLAQTKVHYDQITTANLAPPYKANCREGRRWTFSNAAAGAGSIKSNLDEMQGLLNALLEPETTALEDAIQLATTPRRDFDDNNEIGLGWLTHKHEGRTFVWHNGGTASFASFIGFDREKQRGVVLLLNKPLHDDVTVAGIEFLKRDYSRLKNAPNASTTSP